MSGREPPPEGGAVCDTVVINYFLAVGEFDLLASILGTVQVPRAVFDPHEPHNIADEAASELRNGLRHHQRRAANQELAPERRALAATALQHFRRLPQLCSDGHLVTLDMTRAELDVFAQLRDRNHVRQFGLIDGLGQGEAAAVAIALNRNLALATDDQDAINLLQRTAPDTTIIRIRSLLIEAAQQNLVAPTYAQAIHEAMKQHGFWDSGTL
jgi:predicted nucleic acid-binding protein